MTVPNAIKASAVFITFSGDCRKALTLYHTCFGGRLQFETFGQELEWYTEMPVVSGSLVTDRITIHGSDLVPDEGRKPGNYIAIFLQCANTYDRKAIIERLNPDKKNQLTSSDYDQNLVEITDAFDVRWVLGV